MSQHSHALATCAPTGASASDRSNPTAAASLCASVASAGALRGKCTPSAWSSRRRPARCLSAARAAARTMWGPSVLAIRLGTARSACANTNVPCSYWHLRGLAWQHRLRQRQQRRRRRRRRWRQGQQWQQCRRRTVPQRPRPHHPLLHLPRRPQVHLHPPVPRRPARSLQFVGFAPCPTSWRRVASKVRLPMAPCRAPAPSAKPLTRPRAPWRAPAQTAARCHAGLRRRRPR